MKILSQKIIGKITNYRIGIRSQSPKECLVEFKDMTYGSAGRLVGQKVAWKGKNSVHLGKVMGLHGKSGTVRVRFRRGVPGQAIGTEVKIVS